MLEVSASNALDYVRGKGCIGAGPASVEALTWGVSNAVLRIITPQRTFVVKQSRPQLRTRDAWFSDIDRVFREQEVIQVLYPLLPEPTVPRVLFTDPENYVFAMSHAPAGALVWKEVLLAGEIDLEIGRHAGRILGKIHETTARAPALVEAFRDHTVFVQLRVDPFYRRVQERRHLGEPLHFRPHLPEVRRHLHARERRLEDRRPALARAHELADARRWPPRCSRSSSACFL